jgi:hypothetical protein
MQPDLQKEYERIGGEIAQAGKEADRRKVRFFARIAGICWIWVVIGMALVGESFHIDATVGQFYYPSLMAKAQAFFSAGMFVGTAGPIGTLLWGWRRAIARGYLD